MIVVRALQSENMPSILSTFSKVLKLEMSRDGRLEQPENIERISLTLAVLKLDKFKDSKAEQPENISRMSVTLEVSKPERLRAVKALQR